MKTAEQEIPKEQLEQTIGDQWWRLNNLYYITDKKGRKVKFKPNIVQTMFYKKIWFRNIILKARQFGFTTFICILWLDVCLFNENVRAGIIAHNQEDAKKFFRDKIKFAYDNLPDHIKEARPAKRDAANELLFESTNSSIYVASSMRSGTINYLHISEFGKIAAKYPDKAKEIVTGAFEAVSSDNLIVIESTAEGRSGYFFEYCQTAQALKDMGAKLTSLDFRFHFFPWYDNPEYQLDGNIIIFPRLSEYFKELESKGIELSDAQKAWYVKKHGTLGDDMKREYPSTPEEAFFASIQGAYFKTEMQEARRTGRITKVPYDKSFPVDTYWDLGVNDTNAIWFAQTVGREVRFIDYYENSGEGLKHYLDVLKERGYNYGKHYAPHDIETREYTTGVSRKETARSYGIVFETVPRVSAKEDSIEAARAAINISVFDEQKCNTGIVHLESYRKQWDERLGSYKSQPLHDEHSNGADAYQTFGLTHISKINRGVGTVKRRVVTSSAGGWT
jgi:hypothetical protein